MSSNIIVKLKSQITFLHRLHRRRSDTTYIRSRDGADARFFGFTKMAKNC